MENTSGLKPLGKAVLIRAFAPERKVGKIVIPENVQGKMAMVDNRATVIEVGADAWSDEGAWTRFMLFWKRWKHQPRAVPGDNVLVTKFAGFMAEGPADGQLYRLVNDRDIFCAITEVANG